MFSVENCRKIIEFVGEDAKSEVNLFTETQLNKTPQKQDQLETSRAELIKRIDEITKFNVEAFDSNIQNGVIISSESQLFTQFCCIFKYKDELELFTREYLTQDQRELVRQINSRSIFGINVLFDKNEDMQQPFRIFFPCRKIKKLNGKIEKCSEDGFFFQVSVRIGKNQPAYDEIIKDCDISDCLFLLQSVSLVRLQQSVWCPKTNIFEGSENFLGFFPRVVKSSAGQSDVYLGWFKQEGILIIFNS